MKKIIMIMLAGSLLVFNGCTKTGPVGPQGPQGNANVIGEQPFTVTNWTLTSNVYSATFTDANITQDIVNSGVVEIYKQYSDGSWSNLPDINDDVSTVFNFGIGGAYETGGFIITVMTTDGTTTPPPGTVTFRAVVISSSLRQSHPNTNWKNYNETMAAINATAEAAINTTVTAAAATNTSATATTTTAATPN
jgi:hypothetical protein